MFTGVDIARLSSGSEDSDSYKKQSYFMFHNRLKFSSLPPLQEAKTSMSSIAAS